MFLGVPGPFVVSVVGCLVYSRQDKFGRPLPGWNVHNLIGSASVLSHSPGGSRHVLVPWMEQSWGYASTVYFNILAVCSSSARDESVVETSEASAEHRIHDPWSFSGK